jgi:Rod binding domain-containing protein
MSTDFSLSSLGPLAPLDLSSAEGAGVSDQTRIEKVSKAMESLFVSQMTAEFGKGLGGTSDSKSDGPYQDFIQQAMTDGVNKGGGFGLAKIIENYLSHGNQTKLAHPGLETKNTIPHAQPAR